MLTFKDLEIYTIHPNFSIAMIRKTTRTTNGLFFFRRLIIAIALSVCPVLYTGPWEAEGTQTVDRIMAVVNDEIIGLYELNQAVRPYAERIKTMGYPFEKEKEMLSKIQQDVLKQLIDKKLVDQEVKRFNITVSENEIDSAIARMTQTRVSADDEIDEAFSIKKSASEEYRRQVKENILRAKLINLEVKSKVVLTKKDIAAYYERHKDMYTQEKLYHLRNIVMRVFPDAGETERRSVYTAMVDILKKLQDGESFESLARKYSQSSLAEDGGDLGVFQWGNLSPQLQDALKGLKAGMYTSILDTSQGYQVFYVEEIKTGAGKTLEDATAEIEEKLYSEIVDNKFHSWMEDLRNRSHIKIYP